MTPVCVDVPIDRALADGRSGWVRHARYRMGTVWEMVLRSADRERALWTLDGAFEDIARLERIMSRFLPESSVNAIARAAGRGAVRIEPELAEVLTRAQWMAVIAEGAFDVTMAPLIALWSQAASLGVVPTPVELRAAQALVDYRALVIDATGPTAALLNVGMSLDLGAIGKGFAVDRAVERLREEGYTQGWVNAGGTVRFLGSWDRPVSVCDPRQPDRAMLRLAVEEGAISTSANYERGWRIGERWYGHLLDPRTGWPASPCASVTVLAPFAALADALSTACFVLGPEHAQPVCAACQGVEALWCVGESERSLSVVTTHGLCGRVQDMPFVEHTPINAEPSLA